MGLIAGKQTWTAQELAALTTLAPTLTRSQVAERLGRTVLAVEAKARDLGLRFGARTGSGPHAGTTLVAWTRQDQLRLMELAGQVSMATAAERLGRTLAAIKGQVVRQGLRWRQGVDTLRCVAERLGVDQGTVRRHRDALGQRWRRNGRRYIARGATLDEVQAIARSILESPRSHVDCPLRHLAAIARGEE